MSLLGGTATINILCKNKEIGKSRLVCILRKVKILLK